MMRKIVIASQNPVKIRATLTGFQKMFPGETFEIEGISVSSGVGDQPTNDGTTFQGAWNRAHAASQQCVADFWVGIEGGIEEKHTDMESFAWVVVKSKNGKFSKARTGTFFLPPQVAMLIKQGKELGEADDIVFGRTNSKQDNGAIGILTHNIVDRTTYYADAVVLALIPLKNVGLYT